MTITIGGAIGFLIGLATGGILGLIIGTALADAHWKKKIEPVWGSEEKRAPDKIEKD